VARLETLQQNVAAFTPPHGRGGEALQPAMPPTPPVAANKVIITVSAASDASDVARGCEQGDYHLSEAGAHPRFFP
jgi:hypothetical protein